MLLIFVKKLTEKWQLPPKIPKPLSKTQSTTSNAPSNNPITEDQIFTWKKFFKNKFPRKFRHDQSAKPRFSIVSTRARTDHLRSRYTTNWTDTPTPTFNVSNERAYYSNSYSYVTDLSCKHSGQTELLTSRLRSSSRRACNHLLVEQVWNQTQAIDEQKEYGISTADAIFALQTRCRSLMLFDILVI